MTSVCSVSALLLGSHSSLLGVFLWAGVPSTQHVAEKHLHKISREEVNDIIWGRCGGPIRGLKEKCA